MFLFWNTVAVLILVTGLWLSLAATGILFEKMGFSLKNEQHLKIAQYASMWSSIIFAAAVAVLIVIRIGYRIETKTIYVPGPTVIVHDTIPVVKTVIKNNTTVVDHVVDAVNTVKQGANNRDTTFLRAVDRL